MSSGHTKGATTTTTTTTTTAPAPAPIVPSSSSPPSSPPLPRTKSLQDFSLIENYTDSAYALQRGGTTSATATPPPPPPPPITTAHIASNNLGAFAIENYTQKDTTTASKRVSMLSTWRIQINSFKPTLLLYYALLSLT